MTTIDKIRAEIERLRKEIRGYDDWTLGFESACERILNAIDTMPDEEPVTDCRDLEEEISRTYRDGSVTDTSDIDHVAYENIARHFAEWGEKNAYKAIMKKADEVRDKRFDTDFEIKIEPAAGFDFGCVNVYREGKLVGQYVEPKEEKKLPESVEESAEEYLRKARETPGHEWMTRDIEDAFKAGAEWKKAKMMEDKK